MADEFVLVPQPFRIQDLVAVNGDGIFQRRPESVAGLPHPLDVADEAEGSGAGDFLSEGRGIEAERISLSSDRRGGEIDLDVQSEAVGGRQELRPAAGLLDSYPL